MDTIGEQSLIMCGAWSKAMVRLEDLPRRRRKNTLGELLSSLRPEEVGLVACFTAGVILPAAEMERLEVTPAVIRTAFATVTGQKGDVLEAQAAEAGGFPELAMKLLTPPAGAGRISLLEVRGWLSELLGYSREPLEMMVFLLKTLDPLMSRYLLRALLGELPIGLEVSALLESLALASRIELEAIQQCYELTNDLDDTAERAFRGRRALAQVHCRTGRPYRLMPVTPAASVAQAFERQEGPMIAETEVSGVRLEVHRRHSTIQLFTRQLKDVTRAFPELAVALERSLTGTDDLILEGQVYLPGASAEASDHAVQVRLSQLPTQRGAVLKPETLLSLAMFDLTRQGREDLMERPYEERRRRLRQMFRLSDRLTLPDSAVVESVEAADEFFARIREAGAPGMILKPARSRYLAGQENVWYRVSAEPERLDLAVVAATLNVAGVISRVSLACQSEGGLAVVGELSSSAADADMWKALQARIPALVTLRKGERLTLKPELVVEVLGRSMRRSPRRPSGVTVSGAILRLLREDKSPLEADSTSRLLEVLETLGETPEGADE